jgi:hypothetical protein
MPGARSRGPHVSRTGTPSAASSRTSGTSFWERVLGEVGTARRRISFSISRRRLSRGSCTSSDCSAVLSPSLIPSSMSAWRIQRRTDSGETSKSAATSATVRSPRRATVATSRLNSCGNFLGMVTSFCEPELTHGMSTKPAADPPRLTTRRRRPRMDALNE